MALFLTPLPGDASSRAILPPTDPESGIVTFTARPTQHAWAVGQDLLAALGVNGDLYGSGRAHGEDLTLAHAWLEAHDVRMVIVRHADMISKTDILDDLHHLVAAVGARFVLTCDDTSVQRLADWVHRRDGTVLLQDDLTSLIDQARRATADRPGTPEINYPQALPRAEFYLFRSRARDTLLPAQFEMVDALYQHAFRAARASSPRTAEDAARLLSAQIAEHRTPGEALTIARATQAAMFTQETLLKVDVATLLHGVADSQHRRLTPAEIQSLRAYRTPWRSAAVVLQDANLSKQQIHALTVGQVDRAGHLIGVEHAPMHPGAHVYLRAQRTVRILNGASPDDALIAEGKAYVTNALRRVGADLNLPAPGNHESATSRKADRWQQALGVAVLPLVALHNDAKMRGTGKDAASLVATRNIR